MEMHRQSGLEHLEAVLSSMAREPAPARIERWKGEFDRVAGPMSSQLVLFGSGMLGQLTLERLRRAGVEPRCFSDNNPARWGTKVEGLPVLSPADAVAQYGQNGCFAVTIYNGSAAREQLRGAGCRCVIPFAPLSWKFPSELMPDLGVDAPELIAEQQKEIRECFSHLADERSRHELCDQLQWRYWMSPEYLPLPIYEGALYFPTDLITKNADEVLVDCGAFDGDTVRWFARELGRFRYIYALEPDPKNLAALAVAIEKLPPDLGGKVTALPYAVGNSDGPITFMVAHDMSSKISSSGDGSVLECRKLDSLPWRHTPTYIKMDIEGAEPDALRGAAGLIRKAQPVLAICLYHRSEHLWQIPNLIHSLCPDYSLFLRRYAEDCWEQVCYAVPARRLRNK